MTWFVAAAVILVGAHHTPLSITLWGNGDAASGRLTSTIALNIPDKPAAAASIRLGFKHLPRPLAGATCYITGTAVADTRKDRIYMTAEWLECQRDGKYIVQAQVDGYMTDEGMNAGKDAIVRHIHTAYEDSRIEIEAWGDVNVVFIKTVNVVVNKVKKKKSVR